MLRGPRPLATVRPTLPHAHARLLDEFFAREFRALHALAESAALAMAGAGDAADDEAMQHAVLAGRQAYLSGRMPKKL